MWKGWGREMKRRKRGAEGEWKEEIVVSFSACERSEGLKSALLKLNHARPERKLGSIATAVNVRFEEDNSK